MQLPGSVDPYNIAFLIDRIGDQMLRMVTKDFHRVIDPNRFSEWKQRLLDEPVALLTEMVNDWDDLRGRVNRPDVFPAEDRLPTTGDLVDGFPQVFAGSPPNADPDGTNEAAVRWRVRRLTWARSVWVGLAHQLIRDIDRLSLTDEPVKKKLPDGREEAAPPLPLWSLEFVFRDWDLLQRATLEYLGAKADLLRELDIEAVDITGSVTEQGLLAEAREALARGEAHSYILLEQAVRDVLLTKLGLRGIALPVPLSDVPTYVLATVAHQSGLRMPFRPETIAGLLHSLAKCASQCETPVLSFLYPAFRVLGETVERLSVTTIDESVTRAVLESLAALVEGDNARRG